MKSLNRVVGFCKIVSGVKTIVWSRLVPLFVVSLSFAGCSSSAPSLDESEVNSPKIDTITVKGNPVFTLSYNDAGKVTRYYNGMFRGTVEISYDPLTITLTYVDPGKNGVANPRQVMELYDVQLNKSNFISSFRSRVSVVAPNGEKMFSEGGATVKYNNEGRLTELNWKNGKTTEMTWDKDGRLLSSKNPDYENVYESTDTLNANRQWIPLWYACGGIEMTGLFGNPPAYLISKGVQTFTDGNIPATVAKFDYYLNKDNVIDSLLFTSDDNPEVNLIFKYIND